jgi:hypothetical protein
MWIKAIQSMTKLTRDVVSGMASQEINFWLSLEHALDGIEAQLRSDEVNMVINCLWNVKQFRATVSFIADIGLKDAMDLGVYLVIDISYTPKLTLSRCYSTQIQPTDERLPSK